MNNILKILLAVLAISGLVVMIMPEGDPLASPGATVEPVPVVAPTTQPSVTQTPVQNDESTDESESGEEDYSNFGKPMMDAAPLGGDTSQQNSNPDMQPNQIANAPDTGVPTAGNPNAVMGVDPLAPVQ
jgi:hypothetical protein